MKPYHEMAQALKSVLENDDYDQHINRYGGADVEAIRAAVRHCNNYWRALIKIEIENIRQRFYDDF